MTRVAGHLSLLAVFLLCSVALVVPGNAQAIELAVNGTSAYTVVIRAGADEQIKALANELVLHFEKITGARLPIVTDGEVPGDREILIGASSHLESIAEGMAAAPLADEEYWIRTVGDHLVILGGPRRGVLHGVYTFLEEDLGCRWFSPECAVIPEKPDLSIGSINRRHVPAFEFRGLITFNAESDPVWAARMHLNGFVRHMKDAQGRRTWREFFGHPLIEGSWYWAQHSSHTFPRLVPTETYYEDHPEYYSLVNGERVNKNGQLCMTNPDVPQIAAAWADTCLDQEPKARLVSISADDLSGFCECRHCTAAREKYPETEHQTVCGNASVLIPFVNRVAEYVEKEHPQALVTTLAYQWTRIPAAGLSVRRSVAIRYCPIELCAIHGMDDTSCPWNMKNHEGTRFLDELRTWVAIAPRVWVWYYAFDRVGALQPAFFLKTVAQDFRLFERMGVKGLHPQGRAGGEGPWQPLQHLKSYIYAKLLWNPDYDVSAGVTEFCRAYYGGAADVIEAYAWALAKPETYGNLDGYPTLGNYPGLHVGCSSLVPIPSEQLHAFDAAFDRAETSVAGDDELLRRVRVVRMTLQYAILHYAAKDDPMRDKASSAFFDFARKIPVGQVYNAWSRELVSLDEFEVQMRTGNKGTP